MPSQIADLNQFRADFICNFQRITKNTTPGDAQFLRILIESSRAKVGLEIGTATGYGAMVMGLGFEQTGGRLTSIDCDGEMVRTAREHVRQMQLQDVVTFVEGAALTVIPGLQDRFDFVFLDALKEEYLAYFRAVEPKLAERAIVVADNVIKHADAMQDFLDAVANDQTYQSVTIQASSEKGDGLMVIYKGK
jgi:predicted O-methyltransferase YrrM